MAKASKKAGTSASKAGSSTSSRTAGADVTGATDTAADAPDVKEQAGKSVSFKSRKLPETAVRNRFTEEETDADSVATASGAPPDDGASLGPSKPGKKTAAKTTARKAPAKTSSAATSKEKRPAKTPAEAKSAAQKPAGPKTADAKSAGKSAPKKTVSKTSAAAKGTAKKDDVASQAAEEPVKEPELTPKQRAFQVADAKRRELAARIADDEIIEVDELVEVARGIMGIDALRPGQREALEHILSGEDLLAVMPTGSGKSLLYQLPSLVLPGLTVVVSPLIALIKDQIDKMKSWGVAVCRVDSTLTVRQKREMEALMKAPGGKLVLTTPERMAVPEFRDFLKESAQGVGVSLFVIDEAHCASQWGHDFRPSYLAMGKAIEDLGDPPILCTTATAPPHVRDDILHQIGAEDANIVTTTFDRPNLHYEVIAVPGDDDKNKTLVTLLKKLPKPGIVYCATVKMVNALHESLSRHAIDVVKYHGRLTKKERDENQQAFMDRRDLVMVATNAFGLGVDKSDIRNVLHYHVPGSLEAYAQEAGRGGRDRKPARCVLLFSPDDVAIQEYFLKGSYPTRRQVRAIYTTLKAWKSHEETVPTVANIALGARTSVSRAKTVLNLLKDEGFVTEEDGGIFHLPPGDIDERALYAKAKQYEGRRIADRQRLDALLEYVGTPDCRNKLMLSYLGEAESPACGRCDNCLRSQEAAALAAREAFKLEDGVLKKLHEDDGDEEMHMPRTQTLVKTRVVRIDGPQKRVKSDAGDEVETIAGPAGLFELVEDDDETDDDNYDYFDEDEVEEIQQTAAALAAEGYSPEEIEITILARKKEPKPPKQKRNQHAPEPVKKKRRRRRRRKNSLPKQAAFSSPVLTKETEAPLQVAKKSKAPAGPLVEYVRGPLRINMAPVASANPNDVNKRSKAKLKPKRRKKPAPKPVDINAGSVIGQAAPAPAVRSSASASGGAQGGGAQAPSGDGPKKRRRRRRKKKKGASGATSANSGAATGAEMPVDFFSSSNVKLSPTGIPQGGGKSNSNGGGGGKKKRRRRRKRGSGKNRQNQQSQDSKGDGASSSTE